MSSTVSALQSAIAILKPGVQGISQTAAMNAWKHLETWGAKLPRVTDVLSHRTNWNLAYVALTTIGAIGSAYYHFTNPYGKKNWKADICQTLALTGSLTALVFALNLQSIAWNIHAASMMTLPRR